MNLTQLIASRLLLLSVLVLSPALAPPAPAATTLTLHVALPGTNPLPEASTAPFTTLEQARDAIRLLQTQQRLPTGGVDVIIHPGTYPTRFSFLLEAIDSGTPTAPITYRAAQPGTVRFHGGLQLRDFQPVTDPVVLDRLPPESHAHIRQVNLTQAGLTQLIPFILGGFSSGRGFHTHPAHELFVNGQPMTLARWPNEGFVKTGEVPGPLSLPAWDGRPGTPTGRFRFDGDRPARWIAEPEAWLYGYWFWDWADSYEKIERIDLETREIHLAQPWHRYGYRNNQRYHAVNLLCELDAPGEWYLDRTHHVLYLFPSTPLDNATVELSVTSQPLLHLRQVSHVRFQSLLWECGAADGVLIEGGEAVHLEGCTVRQMAGNGIEIRGGKDHRLQSCDLHTLGRGGVAMSGGDRRTLTPGRHLVENCHIHHLSRIDHTYTPGIWLDGVGHRLRHNLIHHVASSAMRIEGNDHLVELNEAHHVVLESDDQGAVDMFGNPTYRGNVFRHNYWHHLGTWDRHGTDTHNQRAGIRLDDAISGTLVEGNVFQRCSTDPTHFGGVQIHGGKDNLITRNLFVNTGAGVSFTPWGDQRWRAFVAPALDHPAIQRDLYLQRYPDLAHLTEHHDQNRVTDNLALRCGPFFLRLPASVHHQNNRELPDHPGLPEGPDGRLIWSETDATQLGVAHIPYSRIGLYRDPWRPRP